MRYRYDRRALARLIREAQLTPAEVAKRAGVSPAHVTLLAHRPNGPQAKTLARLASALDVSPARFFVESP